MIRVRVSDSIRGLPAFWLKQRHRKPTDWVQTIEAADRDIADVDQKIAALPETATIEQVAEIFGSETMARIFCGVCCAACRQWVLEAVAIPIEGDHNEDTNVQLCRACLVQAIVVLNG